MRQYLNEWNLNTNTTLKDIIKYETTFKSEIQLNTKYLKYET